MNRRGFLRLLGFAPFAAPAFAAALTEAPFVIGIDCGAKDITAVAVGRLNQRGFFAFEEIHRWRVANHWAAPHELRLLEDGRLTRETLIAYLNRETDDNASREHGSAA